MNYQQTIEYLLNRLPMFTRIGAAAYKPDLVNTIRLCEALGDPHKKIKTIHIAGTNGKGSVSHMLAAVLQTAGYKTGLYTSPHLKDFRERIKINGNMIDEDFVIAFTTKVQPLIETIEPSFFEITVAMAFDYFAQQEVDIAVIETGLGGRLDSTNVILPELSIITNIGYDHMHILGNTLQEIAGEKAGIIKQNIPVVIGEVLPETKPVFENAAVCMNAAINYASEKRRVIDWQYTHRHIKTEVVKLHSDEVHFYELDLPGIYQTKNIVTALEAVSLLQQKGWAVTEEHLQKGLSQVRKLTGLHGRWELVHEHPALILDVGHNEDGIKAIVSQLELTTYSHLHIVFGMVKDKEVDKVLSLLPQQATYYFTQAILPRALPAGELKEKAVKYNLQGEAFFTINEAVKSAMSRARKEDLILVCGSVFVVGEVEEDSYK